MTGNKVYPVWLVSKNLIFFVFLLVIFSALPALAQPAGLSDEALAHLRGYFAVINEKFKRDIILIEGPDGRLFFPLSELADYVDHQQAFIHAEDVYGCAPCIPLDKVAEVTLDESRNRADIRVFNAFLPSQKFGASLAPNEELPLTYGIGFASSFNLLARYEEQTDTDSYAADIDFGLALGRLGNLYSSHIFFDDGDSRRGQSYWERYFERAMLQLQLGDVITFSDSFGGALQLGGVRIRRAFETRPDFNFHPSFKYFTEARLPGTLELLINGQSVKKQEYEQGRLSFDSSMPSGRGEMTLVLTDVMGNRTAVRQSLFNTADNLEPGVVDFDFAAGVIRQDETTYEDEYGSAFISTGITSNWTQSLSYQGDKDYGLASTEFVFSFANHRLNIEGAYSNNRALSLEGDAAIVNYSYELSGKKAWGRLGLSWFDTNDFSQYRGGILSGEGGSASLSIGRGQFFTGLRGFEIGELGGGSLFMGYGNREWRLEASGQYLETDDYVATLTISYRPAGRNRPRFRLGHSWERDRRAAGADVSGSFRGGGRSLGYQLAAAHEYDIGTDEDLGLDARAGLSYRGNVVDVRGNYEDVRGLQRGSARLKTGIVVNRHNTFLSSREVTQSYATVLTDRKGVRLKGGGYERRADSDGEVSLPVPAFYATRLTIDRDTIQDNDVLTRRSEKVRVAKGNHAIVEMIVTQSPVIIHILHNGVNDIFLNGRPFVHNDFGAYINQYNAGGENQLEVEGKRYTIVLPEVRDELPIYEFDRENNKLFRVNELFRESE